MQEISKTKIVEELKNLKQDESIILDLSSETCLVFDFLNYQVYSLENLFTSYINRTNDSYNEENFNKFIETYTNKIIERDMFAREVFNQILSPEGTQILYMKKLSYLVDNNTETIKFFK